MDTKHGDFKYFTQLSVETPKVVRHLFPLSENPEENYIAGFSMGGYGSLKWMLRDPEKFAAFGLFSGIKNVPEILPEKEDTEDSFYMFASAFGDRKNVIGTEDDICYMIKKQKDAGKKFPRGYMATGMEDTHYQENVAFMDKYEAMGVEFERIIDHGAHNWEYCNKHVRQFLEWLNIGGTFRREEE